MGIYIRPFALGALTFVPGLKRLLASRAGGSTSSAAYCYSVWLKHMVMLWQSGMRTRPRSMAELGPGDSLGVGLAAMLCGVDEYYALDVIEYANVERNLNLLNELVELFGRRAPRPDKGWPDYDLYLDTRLFPSHILTDAVLEAALAPDRVAHSRRDTGPEKRQRAAPRHQVHRSVERRGIHTKKQCRPHHLTRSAAKRGRPARHVRGAVLLAEARGIHVSPDRLHQFQDIQVMEWPLGLFRECPGK